MLVRKAVPLIVFAHVTETGCVLYVCVCLGDRVRLCASRPFVHLSRSDFLQCLKGIGLADDAEARQLNKLFDGFDPMDGGTIDFNWFCDVFQKWQVRLAIGGIMQYR